METFFDWSEIPEAEFGFEFRNEDGSVDWRKRCLHLAYAADALQLQALRISADMHCGEREAVQAAGDNVYYHLEWLRADYARELEDGDWTSDLPQPSDIEVERITPALKRMLRGIRSDDRIGTLVHAVADAIADSAAEIGEDARDQANDLYRVCRHWEGSRE